MIIPAEFSILKMKYNINAVLVVEGKSDVSYLSSFLNCYFITTNGYDISQEKINFLIEASKKKQIIILSDPDDAGETIRNRLTKEFSDAFVPKISLKQRKNYTKTGIAECDKNEIISALKPYIVSTPILKVDYNLPLLLLGKNNATEIKSKLISKYRLINGNLKSIENQLNILSISKEEISTFIEEIKSDN